MLKNILLISSLVMVFLSLMSCTTVTIDESKCRIKVVRGGKLAGDVNEIEVCKPETK